MTSTMESHMRIITAALSARALRRTGACVAAAALLAPAALIAQDLAIKNATIIDAIATAWGFERRPASKLVWFLLASAGSADR